MRAGAGIFFTLLTPPRERTATYAKKIAAGTGRDAAREEQGDTFRVELMDKGHVRNSRGLDVLHFRACVPARLSG